MRWPCREGYPSNAHQGPWRASGRYLYASMPLGMMSSQRAITVASTAASFTRTYQRGVPPALATSQVSHCLTSH